MNSITQSNLEIPNNYGLVYTAQGAICGYLFEIIHKGFFQKKLAHFLMNFFSDYQ